MKTPHHSYFSSFLFPLSSRKEGQALIESIVAASILTVGFLGLLSLLARSLSVNRVVADNYIATYLGAEGIEVVKNIIDTNILQHRPWNQDIDQGNYEVEYNSRSLSSPFAGRTLFFDPVADLYSYNDQGTVATPYTRKVSIELLDDEIRVISHVSWVTRGGGTSAIDLEDHFYNWRP